MDKTHQTPIIWQLSIVKLLNNQTLITGVILQKTPSTFIKNVGVFKNLKNIFSSYFIKPYTNKNIIINADHKSINTKTDTHGGFEVLLDFNCKELITITLPENHSFELKTIQNYQTTYSGHESLFDVITDVDDTIIKSYTANSLKRIFTILFTPPQKRKPIEFTLRFFKALKNDKVSFYGVSKSESNLFSMLNYFIDTHYKLPEIVLFLSPYLSLKQLIFNKKPENFKQQKITQLLQVTNKKVILFGDDSQKDMNIYYNIAKMFPERILKIYIRQTKFNTKSHQLTMWNRLQTLNIPCLYFKPDTKINFEEEILTLKTLAS